MQSAACNSVVLVPGKTHITRTTPPGGIIPDGRRTADRAAENVGTTIQKSALQFLKNHRCGIEKKQSQFGRKIAANINRQQATFRSVSCKVHNTAVSISTTTKTTKSGEIRCWDSHKPSALFYCLRRSYLHRQCSRTPQEYQAPNRSPLHLGKDCIGRSDTALISSLA